MATNTVITISRQFGSGGRLIGKKLAEKLGVPFYDKELIELAVEESGFSKEIFEKVDERASSSLLYSLSVSPGVMQGVTGMADLPLNDKVFLVQTKIIKEVASKGGCVIVGRCADYILKEFNNVVNVFIRSDMESRIERATNVYKINMTNAQKEIQRNDKKRANYYSFYAHSKWGVVDNYDLCLNSGKVGIDESVEVIADYVRHFDEKRSAE
jgi:cytidylate kinase